MTTITRIDIPIHVATMGLLDSPIGTAVNGWIVDFEQIPTTIGISNVPPNNVGSLIVDPRREWYVRIDKGSPLSGPFSFRDADKNARYLSAQPTGDKLAQLVTYLGERGGDPVTIPSRLFVAFMYIDGRRTLGGRVATFHSDQGLP